ncbi:DUF4389 domain-containing protein [Nocardioides jishulii]|uniref:DUF4389 domain-containing protein n=1 Tax=Nocardioides jishulii TaxID=2575440 RepID=A0A4U2YNI9_9ACTN|nr:DUF4389 domain-containing protein [Nocardioides jishulii]QCX26888.1 DUF4389 domain-containing protein [Nocardioides jishulii]TKI61371.1 DUF4389 domain-containing protein [Nocardioides jishulii]
MTTDPRTATYPLRLEGILDERTSRALWLVKWLLLIPHYVVLFFLWLTFSVFTVMAFFAILVTGRYPRALFDFNVGVLRWSWRVGFYGYSALATDRYPPFSLRDDASYPARLVLQRPEHLSRGLVLVKWWLLAIPHYLVVGLFVGVGSYSTNSDVPWTPQAGLIWLLALVAAVVLLFRRRYPPRIFDFVMGLNRWVYRLAAYVMLMTDRYPPFALDQGGAEPGPEHVADTGTAAAGTAAAGTAVAGTAAAGPEGVTGESNPQPSPSSQPVEGEHAGERTKDWTAGKVASAVIGSVAVVTSLALFLGGTALAAVDVALEDDDGFLMSDDKALTSSAAAITSENLDLGDGPESFLPETILGETKLEVRSLTGNEVFVGVGPTDAVRRYLADVPHDTFIDLHDGRPVYRHHPGTFLPAPPQSQDFWDAAVSGSGPLDLTWKPSGGDWTFVVMNADTRPAIAVDASVGAKLPILATIGASLYAAAAVCLLLGIILIAIPLVLLSRRRRT